MSAAARTAVVLASVLVAGTVEGGEGGHRSPRGFRVEFPASWTPAPPEARTAAEEDWGDVLEAVYLVRLGSDPRSDVALWIGFVPVEDWGPGLERVASAARDRLTEKTRTRGISKPSLDGEPHRGRDARLSYVSPGADGVARLTVARLHGGAGGFAVVAVRGDARRPEDLEAELGRVPAAEFDPGERFGDRLEDRTVFLAVLVGLGALATVGLVLLVFVRGERPATGRARRQGASRTVPTEGAATPSTRRDDSSSHTRTS